MNYELARQLIAEASLKKALMTGDKVARQKASYRQSRLNAQRRNAQGGVDPNVSPYHPDYPLVAKQENGTMSSDELAANAKENYRHYSPSSYGKKLDRNIARQQETKKSWKRDEVKAKKQKKERRKKALAATGKVKPLSEATRSKYLKAISKAGIFGDKTDRNNRELQRRAAMLRRGGAEPRTVRNEISRIAAQNRGEWESQDPNVQMAGYRFANKSDSSRAAGKKSPRSPKHGVYESSHLSNLSRNKSVRKLKRVGKNIRNVGRKLYKALSTPQSSIDAMITGRNF